VSNPLVSVVLPVKDGERFLAEAVESVRAQDYRPLELIVVDGGSADRTAAIARSFPEVRYVEQPDRGVARAWNLGLAHARGPVVAFLSSDDRWTPDKLSRQVGHLGSHPELLFVVGLFRYFLEPGHALPPGFNPGLLGRDLVGRVMETLVARREAFERVGPFNPEFRVAEDVDWFARAKDLGVPMAVVPQVVLHKRVHDRNLSADAAVNTPLLLRALRASVRRQQGRPGAAGQEGGGARG
jgi:glycosyltransferase involved in cell wall biosynthesis